MRIAQFGCAFTIIAGAFLGQSQAQPYDPYDYSDYLRRGYDPPAGYYAPYDPRPPARYFSYRRSEPPAAYEPSLVEVPPPRPTSCGEFRYWNGEYCADARDERPYLGPKP